MDQKLIFDLDFVSLQEVLHSWGEPSYRPLQIWQGLYQRLWSRVDDFTNLPVALRRKLESEFIFQGLKPSISTQSSDGKTVKTAFLLYDGRTIETVLMRYNRRRSICVSTQVGCAMGCHFCATGQMGFQRHLSSGEIIEQVLFFARRLAFNGEKVTNVILMGMGEPFHNYDETMAAIDRLNDTRGFNLGARRFTVSTVGLIPSIRRFIIEKRQVNLAISLHAADNLSRSALLPVNKKYHLEELLEVCREYVEKTHRRITFEWALINGINDTREQAIELSKRLQIFRSTGSSLCHVNVIPLNPTLGYEGRTSQRKNVLAFQQELKKNGIPCTVRLRRGIDIQAGCGQLASQPRIRR